MAKGHRLTSRPVPGDDNGIINAIMRLDHALNTGSSPTFKGITFPDLTANAVLYPDGDGKLTSLAAATNGQLVIGSTGSPPSVAALTGTTNQIIVTPGAGSITLSTLQDIHTGASPTFAGATFTQIATGIFPIAGGDLATKEYIDLAIGSSFDLFLSDTDDAVITDTHVMYTVETGEAESTENSPSLSDGDNQLALSWLSETGIPGTSTLREGVYDCHIHLNKNSGGAATTVYWKLSYVDANGSSGKILVCTSEISSAITTSETGYDIHAVIANEISLGATKRLLFELYANVAVGQNVTITSTMEGTHDSHISFQIPSSVWQHRGDVLDDLNTVGQVGANSEFLVGTAAGVLAWESGATVRTSLGLGTGDSPSFTGLTVTGSTLTLGTGQAADITIEFINAGGTGKFHWDNALTQFEFDSDVVMSQDFQVDGDVGIGIAPNATYKLYVKDSIPTFRIEATANNRTIDITPSSGAIDCSTTLQLNRFSGLPVSVGSSSASKLGVGNNIGAIISADSRFLIASTITTEIGAIIRAPESMTADLMQFQDFEENVLASISANGTGYFTGDGVFLGQTDGAEKISSDADGTLDLYAGTSVDVHTNLITSGDITIFNNSPILIFKDSNNTGDASVGFIEWRDSANTRLGFFGNSTNLNDDLLWKNESTGGHISIQTVGGGEFRIFANTVLNGNSITGIGTLTAEQLTSTDDITMQGELLTLGSGAANDVVTQWVTAGGTGTLHYGFGTQEFDFDHTVIISSGWLDVKNGGIFAADDSTIDANLGVSGNITLGEGEAGNLTLLFSSLSGTGTITWSDSTVGFEISHNTVFMSSVDIESGDLCVVGTSQFGNIGGDNTTISGIGSITQNGSATADLNLVAKSVAIASLADGTDGELITWSAAGEIDTVAVGTAGHVLTSNGVGVAPTFQVGGGGVAAHAILDGSAHTDSVADGVTRGSLIYGNAAPKWDELVIGGTGAVLQSDGTDIAWAIIGFVDRGDPAAVDVFLGAGLTEDGAWHELDLGPDGLNIVPAGAKAILLRASYQANAASQTMRLRKFGNSNNLNTTAVTSQVNGVTIVLDAVVPCDAGSSIEYILSSPQTTAASLTVKGWWL